MQSPEDSESRFIKAWSFMGSYLRARKTQPIRNCEMLIALLASFLEELLPDPKANFPLFTMRVGSQWLQLTINGHDSQGNPKPVSVSEGCPRFLADVASDLVSCFEPGYFPSLVNVFTAALRNPGISLQHKIAILNTENGSLRLLYEQYLWTLPESEITDFLKLRKGFAGQILQSQKRGTDEASDFDPHSALGIASSRTALLAMTQDPRLALRWTLLCRPRRG